MPKQAELGPAVGLYRFMSEVPSYIAPPGQRSGTGSQSVLRYLLSDLARKPAPPSPPHH